MCVCACMHAFVRDDRVDEKYVTDCYFGPFRRECVVTGLDVSNVAAPTELSGCGGLNVRPPPRCPRTCKPLLSNAPLEGCNVEEEQMLSISDLAKAVEGDASLLPIAAVRRSRIVVGI